MNSEKTLVKKCYEEIKKYLKGEFFENTNTDFAYNKITRIMNVLASLKDSKFRNKEIEKELIEKIYEVLIIKIDENDFETIQRCSNLLNVLSEHQCI